MLIAAASGRALAASARRAGFMPLVADAFGDQDTLAAAACHVRVDLLDRPVDAGKLIAALDALARARDPAGIVCGSGFEDRADLLARIAQRWTLLGNGADTVARIKDPSAFAALCRAASIPHPETSLTPPADRAGWLTKRAGGAGGLHVRPADNSCGVKPATDPHRIPPPFRGREKLAASSFLPLKGGGIRRGSSTDQPRSFIDSPEYYFQRRVAGEPVSALMLGDGSRAMVLGFSAQWSSPTPRHPFRYGGAVRPAALDENMKQAMTAALQRLVALVPLVGMNSADFLVDGDAFHLLEVNPRPGASFDLFEPEASSLFALHLDACAGKLPPQAPAFADAMAGAIVYAEHDIAAVPAIDWPDWTADRPVADSRINAGGPLCSVFARAATAQEAKALVGRRVAQVPAMLGARLP